MSVLIKYCSGTSGTVYWLSEFLKEKGYKVYKEQVWGGGTIDIYYKDKLIFSRAKARHYPEEYEILELIEKQDQEKVIFTSSDDED
ncbi:hypothetical protein M0812_16164 [Anaeramoeba flamelloides]|uniref:Uncharacterized protein n=1 Tax=Anaeramoeba flamelloides TaxID=1746091 RepID=A0AAV7ZDM3_9EUKA|nr:hypothetical protein M0812_16164 [Anaeramoeba flamelloides]